MSSGTTRKHPKELVPGDVVERYEVVAVAARGGQSQIVKARDRRLGRLVAIKWMLDCNTQDEVALKRFEFEAQALCRLEHPNLPSIHYMDVRPDGVAFIVMEWLVGRDLRAFLNHFRRLSARDALFLGIEVASPLCAAHAIDIIHRDIKPENIFLCDPQKLPVGKGRVRLTDFGAGRLLRATQRITREDTVIGTSLYMSPEQLLGSESIDGRADVYSLCCVLWEALAGHPLFVPDLTRMPHSAALCALHLKEPPPPLSSVRRDVPSYVGELIDRGLAKKPEDRFDGIAAFKEELGSALRRLTEETTGLGTVLTPPDFTVPEEPPAQAGAARTPERVVVPSALQYATTDRVAALREPAASTGASPSRNETQTPEELAAALDRARNCEIAAGAGGPLAREALENALDDPFALVRGAAADGLAGVGDAISAGRLRRALEGERDEPARAKLLNALIALEQRGALPSPPATPPPPIEHRPASSEAGSKALGPKGTKKMAPLPPREPPVDVEGPRAAGRADPERPVSSVATATPRDVEPTPRRWPLWAAPAVGVTAAILTGAGLLLGRAPHADLAATRPVGSSSAAAKPAAEADREPTAAPEATSAASAVERAPGEPGTIAPAPPASSAQPLSSSAAPGTPRPRSAPSQASSTLGPRDGDRPAPAPHPTAPADESLPKAPPSKTSGELF